MSDDASNKPHPASPKKLQEARDEGKYPKARDTTAIAVMAGVLAVVVFGRHHLSEAMHAVFSRCYNDLATIQHGGGAGLLAVAAPPAFAAAIAGCIAGAQQSGWRLYPNLLKPKFDKFNPITKLKELLSPKKAAFELTIAILRVGIVGYVCYDELIGDVPLLLGLTGAPVSSSLHVVGVILLRMTLKVIAVLIVLAVIDFAHNKYTLDESLKMSDQDIKEEMRQYDQDPKLKGKMRQKMREVSGQRVLAAVEDADAVVTNPTHIAVALRYSDDDFAPIVVAKGHDQLALRIRSEARKHGIPIIENRPLARALDAEVEMGQTVPGQHYVAVAKVLAFVFSLRGGRERRNSATTRT